MCESISGHSIGVQCRDPGAKCKSEFLGRERPGSNAVSRQLDAEVLNEHVVEKLVDLGEPSLFCELGWASAHTDGLEIEALILPHTKEVGVRASADDFRVNRNLVAGPPIRLVEYKSQNAERWLFSDRRLPRKPGWCSPGTWLNHPSTRSPVIPK